MAFSVGLGGEKGSSKSKVKQKRELTGTTEQKRTGQDTTRQTSQQTGQQRSSFWTQPQRQLSDQLGNMLIGQFSAPMPGQNIPGQSAQAISNALTSNYQPIIDPTATENLYQAIEKRTIQDILPKATRSIAGQANLAGMLNSGPGLQMQLDNMGEITNRLAETLAQLKLGDEQQRRNIALARENRTIGAVPTATQFTNNPMNQAMDFLRTQGQNVTDTTQTGTGTTERSYLDNILEQIYQLEKLKRTSKGDATRVSADAGFGIS